MELIRKMKMFYEQSFVLAVFLIASTDAIVGGIPSRRDQFPFFVYLQGETTDLTYECAGVLIDPSWVLTSAHCLKPATEQVVLYFGLNEISHLELGRTKRTILPDNFFLHPLFEVDSLKNDIALIRLPVPVKLNVYIQPIEISSHQSAYRPFAGIVIGNGEREYKGKRSNITHYAPMRVTHIFDCLKAFPHLNNRSTVFCAAGENGESVCYGDSGSPFIDVKENTLVGVTSFVQSGGKCKDPQVFTTIALYRKWISKTTGIKFKKL